MSRTPSRARRRRARIEREQSLQHARQDTEIIDEIMAINARIAATTMASAKYQIAIGDLVALALRISNSGLCVWDFELWFLGASHPDEGIPDTEKTREMRALLAQIVAPRLTWAPPRWVKMRDSR